MTVRWGRRSRSPDLDIAVPGDAVAVDHLDVLVNHIWGGEVLEGGPPEWNRQYMEAEESGEEPDPASYREPVTARVPRPRRP